MFYEMKQKSTTFAPLSELKEWDNERGYLRDICITAQDQFKLVMDYFRILYNRQSKNMKYAATVWHEESSDSW